MIAAMHWEFKLATPLGETRSSYRLTHEALVYESDDVLGGGSDTVHWNNVAEAATASMAGMGGRGAPDLPGWVPEQVEWLIISRTDKRSSSFMRRLPDGLARDELVAALRERLGQRWIGERIPIQQANKRMGLESQQWSLVKVIGLVVAVLALLVLAILLLGLLLSPVVAIPGGVLLGGWLLRRGLKGYRYSQLASTAAPDRIGTAARGMVHFEGRAIGALPSRSAITGRPAVWWDVSVSLFYLDSESRSGSWRQVASRFGGVIDVLELQDDTGRVPVWLRDAELLLERRAWESDKDALPAQGVALLDEMGFPWNGNQRIRVTEECLDTNALLYVVGTLDERRDLPESGDASWLERITHSLRTGQWRRDAVAAAPAPLRVVLAVFIGFLDMFTRIGVAKSRSLQTGLGAPPSIGADARVVWKGRGGQPLLVSDQPAQTAIKLLRQRSLIVGGIGLAIVCYALYELIEILFRH